MSGQSRREPDPPAATLARNRTRVGGTRVFAAGESQIGDGSVGGRGSTPPKVRTPPGVVADVADVCAAQYRFKDRRGARQVCMGEWSCTERHGGSVATEAWVRVLAGAIDDDEAAADDDGQVAGVLGQAGVLLVEIPPRGAGTGRPATRRGSGRAPRGRVRRRFDARLVRVL